MNNPSVDYAKKTASIQLLKTITIIIVLGINLAFTFIIAKSLELPQIMAGLIIWSYITIYLLYNIRHFVNFTAKAKKTLIIAPLEEMYESVEEDDFLLHFHLYSALNDFNEVARAAKLPRKTNIFFLEETNRQMAYSGGTIHDGIIVFTLPFFLKFPEPEERKAVIAHEAAHLKNGDTIYWSIVRNLSSLSKSTYFLVLLNTMLLFSQSHLYAGLFLAFCLIITGTFFILEIRSVLAQKERQKTTDIASFFSRIVLSVMLYTLIGLLFGWHFALPIFFINCFVLPLLIQKTARAFEEVADLFVASLGYADGLISFFIKNLPTDNDELVKDSIKEIFSVHPSEINRIKNLMKYQTSTTLKRRQI